MLFVRHEPPRGTPDTQDARRSEGLAWARIGGISIFWFALNFHWSALLTVVLPSQVLTLVGSTHKVDALAFVLIPGAFVSLIANPLWGWLSDRSHGWLARRGRRRPYIVCGTFVNIGGLLWMASARDSATLALAYTLVQFANNAAQAPFHALLPDIVPQQQRGTASGIMGFLMIVGTIAGVALAGLLLTRFLISLGMALIQNWMQYYLRDVLQFQHAELVTAQFLSVVAIAGLCSAALAGWLSDRYGRKPLIYVAGGLMTLVGISVIVAQAFTHAIVVLFPVLLGAGVLFGIGYGAYQSVDWALVADALPSRQHYARDMGVWNISLSLPQVLAPVVVGPLITTFAQHGQVSIGYQLLFALAALCCLCGTVAVRAIRGDVE